MALRGIKVSSLGRECCVTESSDVLLGPHVVFYMEKILLLGYWW